MPSFKAFAEFQKKVQEEASPEKPTVASRPAVATAAAAVGAGGDGQTSPKATAQVASPKPPASGDAPAEALRVGMKVKVRGLQARPELNGLEGVLTLFDSQRSRWQVELRNGGGAKLFKGANLEQYIDDEDALDILKGKGPAVSKGPAAGAMGAAGAAASTAATNGAAQGPAYDKALDARGSPARRGEAGSKYGVGGGPSAAAVAAAAAVAKGGELPSAAPAPAATNGDSPAQPEEDEDEEGFVRSIEQCLKECDVMWDDY